jgi:cyanate lyase
MTEALSEEEFGDGIMSSTDFELNVDRVPAQERPRQRDVEW